jgi:hypothetical protein
MPQVELADITQVTKALIRMALAESAGANLGPMMLEVQEPLVARYGPDVLRAVGYFLAGAAANGLRGVARLSGIPIEKVVASYEMHMDFTPIRNRLEEDGLS